MRAGTVAYQTRDRVSERQRELSKGNYLFTSPSEVGVVVEVEERLGSASGCQAPETKDEHGTVHEPPCLKTVRQLESKKELKKKNERKKGEQKPKMNTARFMNRLAPKQYAS